MTFVSVNVNDRIKVKLNPDGQIIYRNYYKSSNSDKSVDDLGFSTFQIWEFMAIYGPHIFLGFPTPFETEVIVDVTK